MFDSLRLKNVCELLDIMVSTSLESRSEVRRVFEESAEGFDEVVAFLARLRVLEAKGKYIRLKSNLSDRWPRHRQEEILKLVLVNRNRYRTEIFRFLEKFKIHDVDISYSAHDQVRSVESGVRNFLMDLGVVKHNSELDQYVLDPQYISLFTSARDSRELVSPEMLKARSDRKESLGIEAEEAIVRFERSRVGPEHAASIDHVSRRNSGAGYDIRSVTLSEDQLSLPRFIEVKAVPSESFQFYWSRNEIDVARDLARWYYLYLLPVNRRGKFELENLKVIQDPFRVVMGADSDWVTESDGIVCFQRIVK